ncbi:MAG: nuclear transport factor 2 family protein [Acidobacteriota bacterium]|nr:nuclear transport factor 2 family protein [Acidobacteriota bacterium]
MSNVLERVNALNQMIQEGKIMEAMNEFYTDDLVMAENDGDPCVGLAANLEREQQFVDNTKWYGLELKGVSVGDNLSMVQWWMDFHTEHYGSRLKFTQVAVQKWRDGKIYDERFYYSPTPVTEE